MRKLTPLSIVGAVLRTLNPKVKPVSHKELGGTARLDSLRPEPHRGIAGGARWLGYVVIFPGALCWIALTSPETSPPWLELSLVALMLLGSRFMVRQAKESTSGLLGFSWRTVQDRGPLAVTLALITLTLVIRLIASGLPSSIDATLYKVGSYLFLASCVAGLYSSWAVARSLVRVRRDEYVRMHEWGNPVSGKLKAAVGVPITSPEMHSMVHFESDQVIIDPVPPLIAERFSGIELAMARGHVDDVMLSEDSTPQRICFVPITPEWLVCRTVLRSCDFTLLGFDEREIEDAEILGRSLIVAPDAVNPDASKPAKPRAASAAEHVSEKDFGQIQRFAMDATDSMTIVGYDLNRYNSETRRYEKLIYIQRVSAEEKVILERIAHQLKTKIWGMWLEFHWVENDEDDRGEHPQRIDSVVVKRSPVGGLTPEQREQIWRPVIAMMPKGSNGWMIEDDQQSGFVTLRYGTPLVLPDGVSVLDMIPQQVNPMDWAKIPLGVGVDGKPLGLDLSKVPHTLIAGKPGSGKSTLLRTDMAQRVARGHKLMVFDPFKKAPWATMFKPYTIAWSMEIRGVANALAFVYEESKRRGKVIRAHGKENWYDFSTEDRDKLGLYPISIYFDEYESAIFTKDLKTTALAFGKDSKRYLSDEKYNAAVGLMQHYVAQIGIESRFAGLYLVVATQFPYKEKLGAARNVLGNTIQLHQAGAAIQSSEIGLAMGADASRAVELLTEFSAPRPGHEAPVGLGVIQNSETGTLNAMKIAFLSPDEVVPLMVSLGVPECRPWRVTDALGIGIRAEEIPDPRTPVAPPATTLTHLEEEVDVAHDWMDDENEEAAAIPRKARSKLVELFGE